MLQHSNIPERQYNIDWAKYICSFLIICIHTSYIGKAYLGVLTRVAVPIFFMITGYFYPSIKQRGRECIQLRKIVGLCVLSNIIYFIYKLARCVVSKESLQDYLKATFNIEAWIKCIFFNESLFSYHLWYLSALAYVLIIIFIFDKYSHREKLYKFIPILLLGNIILGNYSTLIFGVRFPLVLSRNFLFCGLPFFLIGDYIQKKQTKLTSKQIYPFTFIAALLTITENLFFLYMGKDFNIDCFITTPIFSYLLFLSILQAKHISTTPILKKIARLGKDTSTAIYIFHPILLSIFSRNIDRIDQVIPYFAIIWDDFSPLFILALSTLLTSAFLTLKNRIISTFQ